MLSTALFVLGTFGVLALTALWIFMLYADHGKGVGLAPIGVLLMSGLWGLPAIGVCLLGAGCAYVFGY